jgi:hypothetical protein
LSKLRAQRRVPLTGYVLQEGAAEGLYDSEGWVASRVRFRIRPVQPVSRLVLRGFRPDWAPPASVRIVVDDATVARAPIVGEFEVNAPLREMARNLFELEIVSDSPPGWAAAKGDDRDLAFLLNELRALH